MVGSRDKKAEVAMVAMDERVSIFLSTMYGHRAQSDRKFGMFGHQSTGGESWSNLGGTGTTENAIH